MKAERLFRAIGLVDDDLVEETAKAPARKRPSWRRYGAMAACLAVLCGTGFAWLVTGGFHGYGAADGNSSAGGSGIQGTGTPDAIQFMSYAGPVLPLTTAEENPGVTAERHTDWDFTPRTNSGGWRNIPVGRVRDGPLYPDEPHGCGCDADGAVSHCGQAE